MFQFRDGAAVCPPDDETYAVGLRRLGRAVQLLLDRHQGSTDTLLVLSHEFAISRMMEMLIEAEPIGRFDHANTGVSLLGEEEGRFWVKYANRAEFTG